MQQLARLDRLLCGGDRDADAGVNTDLLAVDGERRSERRLQPLVDLGGLGRVGQSSQQTTNSSPLSRPTVSPGRSAATNRAATSCSI